MLIPAVAEEHGDVDPAIFITRLELEAVSLMKQIGVEQDHTVLCIWNDHFATIVFRKKFPDAPIAFFCASIGIIRLKAPVQRRF